MATQKEILDYLDIKPRLRFPVLDAGKEFYAAARLVAYCDRMDWAMTVERVVFADSATGYKQFRTWIYTYGNCIDGSGGAESDDVIHPIAEGPDGPIFDGDGPYVRTGELTLRIRDRVVAFKSSPDAFAAAGIHLLFPPRVTGADVLRLLAVNHRDVLLASRAERMRRIRGSLPALLQLDQWHHPNVLAGELPSDTECFRILAAALANCDASLYRPAESPNTDWRNWPNGGMM